MLALAAYLTFSMFIGVAQVLFVVNAMWLLQTRVIAAVVVYWVQCTFALFLWTLVK